MIFGGKMRRVNQEKSYRPADAKKIAADVEAFLANGGEIQQIEIGVLGQPPIGLSQANRNSIRGAE